MSMMNICTVVIQYVKKGLWSPELPPSFRFLVDSGALLLARRLRVINLPKYPIPCFRLSLLSKAASRSRFQILVAPTSEPMRGMSASGLGSCQLQDLKKYAKYKVEPLLKYRSRATIRPEYILDFGQRHKLTKKGPKEPFRTVIDQ